MATQLKARLDYDDYCAIPADGNRYELIDGRVHVTPAPSPRHQRVSKRLQRLLEDYFEASGGGEVFNAPIDVILTHHDVVQPDLVVVTDPSQVSERAVEGAPTLLVEVLSPSTTAYDRTTKAQRYATLGVPHYWIADPAACTIECFRLHEATYTSVASFVATDTLTHPDFPGLRVDLAAVWR
jgi:Uma2 family endonuclease